MKAENRDKINIRNRITRDLLKGVSGRIIKTMYEENLTIDEMADRYNIPKQTLNKCITGKVSLNFSQFIDVCNVIGFTIQLK